MAESADNSVWIHSVRVHVHNSGFNSKGPTSQDPFAVNLQK